MDLDLVKKLAEATADHYEKLEAKNRSLETILSLMLLEAPEQTFTATRSKFKQLVENFQGVEMIQMGDDVVCRLVKDGENPCDKCEGKADCCGKEKKIGKTIHLANRRSKKPPTSPLN